MSVVRYHSPANSVLQGRIIWLKCKGYQVVRTSVAVHECSRHAVVFCCNCQNAEIAEITMNIACNASFLPIWWLPLKYPWNGTGDCETSECKQFPVFSFLYDCLFGMTWMDDVSLGWAMTAKVLWPWRVFCYLLHKDARGPSVWNQLPSDKNGLPSPLHRWQTSWSS